MAQPVSGIEITARCPLLMSQQRINKVDVEVDGVSRQIGWDAAEFFAATPGKHMVKARVHGRIVSSPFRSMEVQVEAGQIVEVGYSLSMLALVNPGKLEVKNRRAAGGGTSRA